jgi:hypothetical protein
MERNLRANLASMAGTVDVPLLGGELWEAVRGGTATTAIREVVRAIKARSPQHQLLVEVFEDAGRGVVPACLVGETLEKKMTRWGARIVLLDMAARVTWVILEADQCKHDHALPLRGRMQDQGTPHPGLASRNMTNKPGKDTNINTIIT